MPDYPPFPLPQVPELCIPHRKVEITSETSSKLLQNTLRSTGKTAVEKYCHFHMLGYFFPRALRHWVSQLHFPAQKRPTIFSSIPADQCPGEKVHISYGHCYLLLNDFSPKNIMLFLHCLGVSPASWHYLCTSPIQINRYIFISSSNRYFVEELVSAKCGIILIYSGSLPFSPPTQNWQHTNHIYFSAVHHLTESKCATEIHLRGPLLQHKQNSAACFSGVTFQDPPDIDLNPC